MAVAGRGRCRQCEGNAARTRFMPSHTSRSAQQSCAGSDGRAGRYAYAAASHGKAKATPTCPAVLAQPAVRQAHATCQCNAVCGRSARNLVVLAGGYCHSRYCHTQRNVSHSCCNPPTARVSTRQSLVASLSRALSALSSWLVISTAERPRRSSSSSSRGSGGGGEGWPGGPAAALPAAEGTRKQKLRRALYCSCGMSVQGWARAGGRASACLSRRVRAGACPPRVWVEGGQGKRGKVACRP